MIWCFVEFAHYRKMVNRNFSAPYSANLITLLDDNLPYMPEKKKKKVFAALDVVWTQLRQRMMLMFYCMEHCFVI